MQGWSVECGAIASLCSGGVLPTAGADSRNIPLKGSRQSAYKFRCRRGYKLYGVKRIYCEGDDWSNDNLPVCTGTTA